MVGLSEPTLRQFHLEAQTHTETLINLSGISQNKSLLNVVQCICGEFYNLPRFHFKRSAVKEWAFIEENTQFPAVMINLIDEVFQTVVRIKWNWKKRKKNNWTVLYFWFVSRQRNVNLLMGIFYIWFWTYETQYKVVTFIAPQYHG